MQILQLPLSFYQQDTLTLSQLLLGTFLVHESAEGLTMGKVVETEAYLWGDPACHAYRKKTPRNAAMFLPAGHAYIYQIYGMHFCFNVVTAEAGVGEAVLIRALEPVEGIELMESRRHTNNRTSLCSGPGKLVRAMGITRSLNETLLTGQDDKTTPLYFLPAEEPNFDMITTTRIGITQGAELLYRFYIKGNPYISRK
ncbi:MAG: DNA-3-methyladenine glycosylase [Bacteroidota bacterium]